MAYSAATIKAAVVQAYGNFTTDPLKDAAIDIAISEASIEMQTLIGPGTKTSSQSNLLWFKIAMYKCGQVIIGLGDPRIEVARADIYDYVAIITGERAGKTSVTYTAI